MISRRTDRFVPRLLVDAQDFRRLWIGQTISVVGDQITLLGVPLVAVLVLEADANQMGLLTAAGVLPNLIVSLPFGVWLDRIQRRRRVMIVADLARAAIIASIPLAFALNVLTLPQLYVVAFAVGTLAVAFDVAWNTIFVAVTPRERFTEALSLLNGSRSIASVLGPSLGGILVQLLTAPIAMLIDAVSYLGSVMFLRRIRTHEPPVEPPEGNVRAQLAAGLAFLARDALMRPALLAVATVNLFNYAFAALFILYVTTILGVSPGALGLALGTGAIGGVAGAVVASKLGSRVGIGPAYAIGLIVFPASCLLIPLAGPELAMPVILAILFVSEFLAGLGVMILDINAGVFISARTPDRIRSRVMGAFRFINGGVRPVGAIMGGMLGGLIGVREALLASAIASCLGVLWLVGTPVLRQREVPEPAPL